MGNNLNFPDIERKEHYRNRPKPIIPLRPTEVSYSTLFKGDEDNLLKDLLIVINKEFTIVSDQIFLSVTRTTKQNLLIINKKVK